MDVTTRLTDAARPRRDGAAFLYRALTEQTAIGAIAPTSPTLAGRLAALIPPAPGLRVLELGAGTGAISAAIAPRLGPGAVHVALERDPTLLAGVEHAAPSAVRVAGDAADLRAHLDAAGIDAAGIDAVEVVLSSLPWSNFDPAHALRTLDAVRAVLAPGGVFATIAYHPARLNPRSRRFRRQLESTFGEVVPTATTWASLPPARLLVCRRPRSTGRRG